ncbi:acyl-CoA thioesterase [Aspergillus tanneri]|uniref:Capsule polysaccharide biosynthesis protein n=1 Tax=Aspergillus tanneri TaxID=1220188 RepID=A0A5M9MAE5_9EURO|nr:uncharacterized protein ATNIH1004_011591 [Aspergillus tanneri]KAA8642646.1 hypothetical protein ATNIH1004_011591 [Aspergillus tanneri]
MSVHCYSLYSNSPDSHRRNHHQVRLIQCLQQHILFNHPHHIDIDIHGPESLFYPVITTSRSPLLEIDYNLHKSNATYFTDLDINRVHLIACLFKNQLALGFSGGDLNIALGSTACVFRREIKPYQAYEIHTRVLAWDEKWLYLVSHFVIPSKKPTRASLFSSSQPQSLKNAGRKAQTVGEAQKAILASAITRYVFKRGRISVAPENVLTKAKLLPPRQDGSSKRQSSSSWTWETVEGERQQGLKIAMSFLGLDALHGIFNGNDGNAIGVF